MKKKAKCIVRVGGAAVDADVFNEVGRTARRWRHENPHAKTAPILGLDTGSVITGWCFVHDDGDIEAGEGAPLVVMRELSALLAVAGPPAVFAREGPYTVSREQMARPGAKITPMSLYRLGFGAGYVTGGIAQHLGSPVLWEPAPSTWRAVHGLNRASTDDEEARDRTAQAVLDFARERTGMGLVTGGDRERIDMANAIGIALAAWRVAKEAEVS